MDPRRLPRARGAVASTERRRAPARSAAPAVGGAALTVSMAEERLLAERPGAMTPPPNPVVTVLLCAPSAPAPGASTADGRRLGVRPGATPGAWLPSPIQDEHDPDPLVKDDELAVSETDSRRFGHITSGTVPRTVFLRCRKEALPSSPSASASVSRPAAGADAAGSACSCAMAAARNPAELSLRPPLVPCWNETRRSAARDSPFGGNGPRVVKAIGATSLGSSELADDDASGPAGACASTRGVGGSESESEPAFARLDLRTSGHCELDMRKTAAGSLTQARSSASKFSEPRLRRAEAKGRGHDDVRDLVGPRRRVGAAPAGGVGAALWACGAYVQLSNAYRRALGGTDAQVRPAVRCIS